MGREMNELQWHIEWRDPNTLIPYENNAKQHDGKNISNIAASIKKGGWQQPIVITKSGIIVIGHGRRLAAIELGCKCPCKVIEADLTPEEIRELRVADNLTHDNKYDWEQLFSELSDMELDFSDFDFDLGEDYAMEEPDAPASRDDAPVSDLPDMGDDGYEEYQEPLSDEELAQYSDNAEQFLLKRRVIITYKPEQEEEVRRMLGITEEKVRVVYDLDELLGVTAE